MTDADLVAAVRNLHPYTPPSFVQSPAYCPSCTGSWPCPTAKIVYSAAEISTAIAGYETVPE